MKIEIHLFVAFIILYTSISHSSKLPDKKGTQAQALEPDALRRKHRLAPYIPRDPGDPRNHGNPGGPPHRPDPEQPPDCPPEGCK
ncbi:hypothetical protein O181_111920 [Austropuccinia psidii MF-1]|uniref:Uncharacterized protein n=1 Tax=Austropuccinia psidii MF-1 TaxID=1389203 RepID=A0A9Q3JZE5_9BASI|nr:hypothetical protein [Austropuccinia psidii MF-1]